MAEPISPMRRGGSQSFAPPLLLAEHQMSSHGSMSCVPTPATTLTAFALLLTHAPRWQSDPGGAHSPRARTAGAEQPLEGRPAEPTVDPRFAQPGSCTAQRPRPGRGRRACGGRAAERRERPACLVHGFAVATVRQTRRTLNEWPCRAHAQGASAESNPSSSCRVARGRFARLLNSTDHGKARCWDPSQKRGLVLGRNMCSRGE